MASLRTFALVSALALTESAIDSPQVAVNRPASFRIRSDFSAPLNADRGWAGALNQDVSIYADRPFRVRFELQRSAGSTASQQLRLQYRRNDGDWTEVEAHDFPKPDSDDAKTPRVSIVSCAAYENGAATTDLLAGSTSTFSAGSAVSLADRMPAWSGAGSHGEFEWALVIRRFADGAVTNEKGDTFEFSIRVRMERGSTGMSTMPVPTAARA